MTKALTYVELDVPFCTRSYGVAPCRARLATGGDPVVAQFDGVSSDWLTRGAGLTGAADGKQITFSCWARIDTGLGGRLLAALTALNGGTQGMTFNFMSADNRFRVQGYNAAGTVILDQRSSVIPFGSLVHLLCSFDLTNSANRHIYISDVSDLAVNTTFTNDTLDLTMPDWAVGALGDGTSKLDGDLAELWFARVYMDLSITANRRKFITADLAPVSLGATGNTPTGSAPLVFLSGAIAAWHTNKGSGGGFTLHGALTAGSFSSGAQKCFNTKKTCQDRSNFGDANVTLRFAKDAAYLPREIDAFPSILDVAFTPATISLGENLGQRATLQITFKDHFHSDTGEGFDKYLLERPYDPFKRGTFWGKFRARQPYLRGAAIRWISGTTADNLAGMPTRHFIVNSFDGPSPDGKFTIIAKDVLKLADGDRAQAPAMSQGFIVADITSAASSASLSPTGIGATYPASGLAVIGGNEVVSFTRSSDTLTLTGRGQLNTAASAHKAQDRVQLVLTYSAADVADIIRDLLVNYADGIDPAWITLADWKAETASFLGRLYSANICEPTSVATLISELIQQAALSVWWDDLNQKIRLQVLRSIVTDAATFTPDNMIAGSLTIKEQPDRRISQVWVYFGQISPLKQLSDTDNFRSTSISVDAQSEANYGSSAIKKISSRWIPALGRTVADRLGAIQLGRYKDPPRRVTFDLSRYASTDVMLGGGYRIEAQAIQDATGAAAQIPVQLTRLNAPADRYKVEAEEMIFVAPPEDLTTRTIIVDSNIKNINLRTVHDAIYPVPVAGDVVVCRILAGVRVGSSNRTLPAFNVGSWPSGVSITLIVEGSIYGAGGYGGTGAYPFNYATNGVSGGPALYARYTINMQFPSGGKLWGGGGGGGGGDKINDTYYGAAGGGGFGDDPGLGNNGSASGTLTSGGAPAPTGYGGGFGGYGGGPGQAGSNGQALSASAGVGGAAGPAIDGVAYVTTTVASGDAQGPQI